MKSALRIIFISSVLALSCGTLSAQYRDTFDEIRKDPLKAGNVLYMYNHDVPAHAKAPAGYKPFYISHYGRHGARNHSQNKDFTAIMKVFSTARQKGLLTPRGEKCYEDYAAVFPVLDGCGGDISDLGIEQQHKIAHNMYRNYKSVLKKGAKVDAVATTVPRVILSMTSFCDQLQADSPGLRIERQSSSSTMYYLNPFTTFNPDVDKIEEGFHSKKVCWSDSFYDFMRNRLRPDEFFSNLFTDLDFLNEFGDRTKLEFAFYEVLSSLQNNGKCHSDLSLYFDIDELCRAFEASNYRFYVTKGPDTLWQHGRQYAFAWRTINDIIEKADKDIESGEYAARLRFGHDIIVMSMFKILEVEGYNRSVGNFDEVRDLWRSYDFPVSLNLQFIFYRNRGNDILVRVMYNERDLELPLKDCGTRYYYRWEDLRSYMNSRIEVSRHIIATYPCVK